MAPSAATAPLSPVVRSRGISGKGYRFRVVYRGITEEMARRLEKENVFTKPEHTEATLRFWNALDPLETRRDAWRNIMVINLPENTRGLYDRDQDVVILQHNLTLKCTGIAEFKKIQTPDGVKQNIRVFAMEVVR